MTQEVLKLALEALENAEYGDYDKEELNNAITSIKEALAQHDSVQAKPEPEQEPVAMVESVATVVSESGNQEVTMSWWHEPALPVGTKLYTTPPQRTWVGLTDEEYAELAEEFGPFPINQIEAKLKEKNT